MSFWVSKKVKSTRKQHKCEYCNAIIPIGSSCNNEVGTYAGDFNNYYLCDRCVVFMKMFRDNSEDELGYFTDAVYESDLLDCPKCNKNNLREYDWTDDMQSVQLECDICEHKWTVDLSLKALQIKEEKQIA